MRRTRPSLLELRRRRIQPGHRQLDRRWSPPERWTRLPADTIGRLARPRRNIHAEPASGPHARCDEMARLEAAIFLAREPLSLRRLAKLAGLADGTRARTLVRDLTKLYDDAGSAFRVEQIAGGFMLMTRAPFGPWVRRLLGTPPETRLSAPALETLAIVAYRQPTTRSEIEAIRGVGCEDMLRQLMERDFVAIGGRTEDLGRPNVYVTTRRFLQAFGLARIDDLPPIDPAAVQPDRGPGGASDTPANSAA